MVDIVFKNDMPGNPGTGTRLPSLTVDTNFYNLKVAVEDALTNPLQPLQIADIQVIGNQMTIILSDFSTTFGPFTLPSAAFRWMGEWQPSTDYLQMDIVTALEGMFLVLQDHTSDFTFDPNASNVNGPLYQLIFPIPNIYQMGFFIAGQPGNGIIEGRPVFAHLFTREVTFDIDFVGSAAILIDPPDTDVSFDIQKNGVTIGLLSFDAYATVGVFTVAVAQDFVPDDVLTILRPVAPLDLAYADLTVTLNGTLVTLS